MLVSLSETYCLLMTFTVRETEKVRFCASEYLLTSTVAASHQYYCLAKQLLINHTPSRGELLMVPLDQSEQQVETIDLLRRACAVAESHTDAMGIVLMSTLPILACKDPRFPIEYRHLEPC